MSIAVIGLGATGSRAARQLRSLVDTQLVVCDEQPGLAARVASSLGGDVEVVDSVRPSAELAAVLIVTPVPQAGIARPFIEVGIPVVTVSNARRDLDDLFELGDLAVERGVPLVLGASFSPGFSCLLARFAARSFDEVQEVHVAKHGTGGPACAREHHHALASNGQVWRDNRWEERFGGSGRELCWFPDPIGARDCYNADLPDSRLLLAAFPESGRLSARLSATRRDRLTSRLPMLSPPHAEGGLGAIRVEVRGTRNGVRESMILGAVDRPAIAAGAVAAASVLRIALPRELVGPVVLGDARIDTVGMLHDLAGRGVKAAEFIGLGSV